MTFNETVEGFLDEWAERLCLADHEVPMFRVSVTALINEAVALRTKECKGACLSVDCRVGAAAYYRWQQEKCAKAIEALPQSVSGLTVLGDAPTEGADASSRVAQSCTEGWREFKNKKNGLVYEVLHVNVIDQTNSRVGENVIVYREKGTEGVSVRNRDEFFDKFVRLPAVPGEVETLEAGECG